MLTVEEAKERFRGVVVPLATIFTDDGSLDTDATAANAQWIIDQGGRRGTPSSWWRARAVTSRCSPPRSGSR